MTAPATRRGTTNRNARGNVYDTRDNIRPACGDCNSETGGALATRRPLVLGVDPGPTSGIARIGAGRSTGLVQCTASETLAVVRALADDAPDEGVLVAVERFVVRARAGRSSDPGAGAVTRDLVRDLTALERPGLAVVLRSASEVKPWATDDRLRAAGLFPRGMPHARDGGRHALFAAVHDCGLPDPLSRHVRRQTAAPELGVDGPRHPAGPGRAPGLTPLHRPGF